MKRKPDVPWPLSKVLPKRATPEIVACFVCAECGEVLWRASQYWTCPKGHGRLVSDAAILDRVCEAERLDKRIVKNRCRIDPQEVMRKIQRLQRSPRA